MSKKRGGVRKTVGNENHVSKRNKERYRALKPEMNLKSRYEEIEDVASYINDPSITEEEREWMNTFMQEYTCANLNHGKDVLHNTKELKKSCYDRNNARNRCQLTRKKASGEIMSIEELRAQELGKESPDYTSESDS